VLVDNVAFEPTSDGGAASGLPPDPRIETLVGDLSDESVIASVISDQVDVVFHLASVVSAGAEQEFDLGYQVNLFGTIALLERCRAIGTEPMVVFASSLATFGPDPEAKPGRGSTVDDRTGLRPETSYGVQKACCELLINDYRRKGFIDGRVLRLPTVVVRPGKPNRAASGFASGIVREPVAGIDMVCPVRPDTVMAVISPDRVIDGFETMAALDSEWLGSERTVLLPALSVSMADAVSVTEEVVNGALPLGRVVFEPDPDIQRIIDSWPSTIVADRAKGLGFVGDDSVGAIVRQHLKDEYPDGLPPGLVGEPPERPEPGLIGELER
jgi:nucleoside-diphosphate-sugar epimerase